MTPDDRARYRFGAFDFDANTLELRRGGRVVRVRPQSLRLLVLLVARPHALVGRDEIQQALWGRETFVDFEQGVNHCIRELRAALGDPADTPRYIQTLPRRGYRFIAEVVRVGAADERLPLPGPVAVAETPPPQAAGTAGPPVGSAARVDTGRGRVWLWLTALSVIVLTAAIVWPYTARPGGPVAVRPTQLVVLPFSTNGDQDLGIGLAEAIAVRLGGQHAIAVPGGPPAAGPGGGIAARAGSPPEHVAHTLEGELRASGTSLAVAIRLTDPATGRVVWSDRFSVRADELFSVEDVVADRVAASLDLHLAAAEQERLRRRYTREATAYQDYLRGRAALVRYTPDGVQEAIRSFEAALARDPKYALARAGLAMACADMYLRFAPTREAEGWGERTEREARSALALDPDLAEAHLARAAVARKREFDWNTAMVASRRALVLNPNLEQAHFFIAAAYYHLGYMEEARLALEKGRALHGPDVIEPTRIEALTAFFSGNFLPARVRLEEVSRASSRSIGDVYLALAYHYTGHHERGRAMLESLVAVDSASTAARARATLAGIEAAHGNETAARRHLALVLAGEYRDHHVAYSLGAAYGQLGDTDAAVRWLTTAADTGFPCPIFYENDPLLAPLRSRPEYARLIAHVRAKRAAALS